MEHDRARLAMEVSLLQKISSEEASQRLLEEELRRETSAHDVTTATLDDSISKVQLGCSEHTARHWCLLAVLHVLRAVLAWCLRLGRFTSRTKL